MSLTKRPGNHGWHFGGNNKQNGYLRKHEGSKHTREFFEKGDITQPSLKISEILGDWIIKVPTQNYPLTELNRLGLKTNEANLHFDLKLSCLLPFGVVIGKDHGRFLNNNPKMTFFYWSFKSDFEFSFFFSALQLQPITKIICQGNCSFCDLVHSFMFFDFLSINFLSYLCCRPLN